MACHRLRARAALAAAIAAAALGAGWQLGSVRLRTIDAGALSGRPGAPVSVAGHVAAVPRRSGRLVRVQLETAGGKLLLQAPEPVADLQVGAGVRATGRLARPPQPYRDTLRRQGIALVLNTRAIEPTGELRDGLAGRLDAIRERAVDSLGRGIPAREAALAQGFVLGQDDRIDPATVERFRRSGLSHLLAVSGQNVLLLALLAAPLLAALAIPLRARLLWLLVLIAAYVPLAGAGPSIQRAGVMGAAAVVGTLAGRPAARAYALLVAAAVTLAINPRACADPGWQLSFAAVAGIFLLGAPLRVALTARLGGGPWQRGLAEGITTTVAATLATAPLVGSRFGGIPVAALPANLIALPAVAPSMWLGMTSAALGQLPGLPVEPLNWLNGLLLAYIAQVAAWFSSPSWAVVDVRLPGALGLAAAYALLAAVTASALRLEARRRVVRARGQGSPRGGCRRGAPPASAAAALAVAVGAALVLAVGPGRSAGPDRYGLRVDLLDVGQGDAVALQAAGGPAVLIDGGPPTGDLEAKLREAGIERLGAAIVTHDQADHAGGIAEILGEVPVGRLAYFRVDPALLAAAREAGVTPLPVRAGSSIEVGNLHLEVLWPPAVLLADPSADPNSRSLVILARWRGFSILLTGDAEAEAVPIDPGPVDVLKVAHHGSEDAGLASLLSRTSPALALISAGEGNSFGHPAPATLRTLAEEGVRVLRTDRDGTISLQVASGTVSIEKTG